MVPFSHSSTQFVDEQISTEQDDGQDVDYDNQQQQHETESESDEQNSRLPNDEDGERSNSNFNGIGAGELAFEQQQQFQGFFLCKIIFFSTVNLFNCSVFFSCVIDNATRKQN